MKRLTRLLIVGVFVLLITGCSFRLEGEIRPLDLQQNPAAQSD